MNVDIIPATIGDMEKLAKSGDDSIQFSHTFDEQIGSQLKAGFVITGAYDDFDNDVDAIADGIPSYWATRAAKNERGIKNG